MKKTLPGIIILAIVVFGVVLRLSEKVAPVSARNFEECVALGNPILESYPRQCRQGEVSFVEVVSSPEPLEQDTGPEIPATPRGTTTQVLPKPSTRVCTADAKICPDGSGVGRSGPKCEFAACPVVPVSVNASSTGRAVSVSVLEMRIHELVNKERMAHGLSALAWQPLLLPIARAHSSDMAKRNYFSHNSPEGEDFSMRYQKGGFPCRIQIGNTLYLGAENLYQNNLYDSWSEKNGVRTYNWNSEEAIALSTVAGWMQSPGHRENILAPQWQAESIGVAFSVSDQVLITQNFC